MTFSSPTMPVVDDAASIGWFTGLAGKMTVAFTAVVLLHILYVFFHWGGEDNKSIISNIVSDLVAFGTLFYSWRASRTEGLSTRSRLAWSFIAGAQAAFLIGSLLWTYYENYLGEQPFPSLADTGYLLYYPLTMIGLLLLAEPMKSTEERLGFTLDSALIMIGGGLVMWYFLLQPLITAADGFTLMSVLSIGYPIGDLILMFGIVAILLRRRVSPDHRPVTLLMIGLGSTFAADFIFGYQSINGTYVTGNWVDALWTIGCLPIVLGAHYRYLSADRGAEEAAVSAAAEESKPGLIWLPYFAVACAFGILVLIELDEMSPVHGLAISTAAGLTALVIFRQFMFVRENMNARAALTGLEERIQGIYAASSDGIAVADFDGKLLEVNDAFSTLMGYPRDELISEHTIFDLTPSEHLHETHEVTRRVIESQASVEYEKEYVRKDKTTFNALVTVFPIRSPQGDPSAIAAIIRDITERKQSEDLLREAEDRWQTALRVNRDGVWDWDLRKKKYYFSPRWREMFGYSEEEEIPFSLRSYDDFFHPDDLHLAHATRDELTSAASPYIDVEFRHRCKDGTYRWVRCRAESVMDKVTGRLERVIGLNTDISEKKRREQESDALGSILKGVSETSNLDELLSLVHQSIGGVVHAKNCFIALHDVTTNMFTMQFFVDEFDEVPASANLEGTRSHYVFRTGRALMLDEATTNKLQAEGKFRLVGTQPTHWLGVPLRTPSRIIGVLVVQSYEEEHSYSNHQLEFLNNVAGPIALAIERKRAESRMLLLNTALDAAANGIVITDTEGKIEWVNQAFSTLTGYAADEAKGTVSNALMLSGIHSDDMWETITKNGAWKGEITNKRKSGELYEEEVTITPVFDEASGTRHFISIRSDITDRRKAQDALRSSEEQHRLLFESNPFPVYVYDTETLRFLAVNKSAIDHYGYTRDEFLTGMTLADIRPPEDVIELRTRVASVVDGQDTIAAPSRHLMKDGTITQVEITSHVVTFTGRRSEIVLVNDITDRLRSEQQLKIFNQKLQQSNRELQEFAYVASHDLQEPLRKVQTFSDRLTTKYASALDETGLDYLERMRNAANRMQNLIQDLLSFSRVTTQAKPFVPVDLAQITRDVLSDLEVKIEETGATIETHSLPVLDADASQMRQLFQNLITNALKFTREGIPPVVKISAEQLSNGQTGNCQITVEDNGIGFDEKYVDKIFTVFQRLHGRTEYEGSGIGLAVCRKIVERHHGEITAKSTPGNGAKFQFTLPGHQSGKELN